MGCPKGGGIEWHGFECGTGFLNVRFYAVDSTLVLVFMRYLDISFAIAVFDVAGSRVAVRAFRSVEEFMQSVEVRDGCIYMDWA